MSDVIEVTSLDALTEKISEDDHVVVDFAATWCGPCKVFRRHFDASAQRSDATFVHVYVDEVDGVADTYAVSQVPTVMEFKGGEFWKYLTSRTAIPLLREIESV